MNRKQIIKIYGEDYKAMTKKLLTEAGLIDAIMEKQKQLQKNVLTIGIKPNLVSDTPPSLGATTHPEIAAGIIEYLQEQGEDRIVMLESSWVGGNTRASMEVCGYDRLSEQYGVPFWDLQKDTAVKTDCAGMEIRVCSHVGDVDFLINVPVLKGHCQTKITCALKNMKGLIPGSEKRHFHAWGLHKPIAHLNAAIRQDFIVVDHICGDLDFEDGGHPVVRNCIMAGRDPVLIDAYGCERLHLSVKDVPYIGLAEELGVGSSDAKHAEVIIIGTRTQWNDMDLPYASKVVELKDAVEEVESCSACYGCLLPALERLKEEGLFEKLQEKLCIGQGYRGKTGKLGVGNCTSKFDFSVKGCPPTEQEIYEALKQYINK